MVERTTCVIAGGGPAGMVMGLLLARGGVDVTVLEKHGDFLRDFRGDTVHPTTIRLVHELGLGPEFEALPQSKITEIAFPMEDGRRLVVGDLKRLKVDHPYVAMVPQWDFLDLIADAGRREPHFTLRMNSEVTGLLKEGGRVTGVRVLDRETGTESELHADLTVAADGRWSIVREQSGLPVRDYPVPFDAWWFRLPRHAEDAAPALTPGMRDGQFAVAIPREDYFQIAYIAAKGLDARLRTEGVQRFRERVTRVFPWAADRMDAIESMDDVKHLDVRLNRLTRWHTEGLLCIGDAAHAMSPIGGVGINLAVQDAVAAAAVLAEPLRTGALGASDLRRVRIRRWLPTVLVQGLQRVMHRQIVAPTIEGRRMGPPPAIFALLRRAPWLSAVPAYLIGVGVRSEHAPEFARRAPVRG